jgi:septal ring factor EnvC (AmiA/AmiB activator)
MSITIASITDRVKQIEQAISASLDQYKQLEADLAQRLANHNALLGALEEAKSFLGIATQVANTVAPASPIIDTLDAVNTFPCFYNY